MQFNWERLDDLLADGLSDLAHLNHEEIEAPANPIALSIDWNHYRELERLGTYRIVAARTADGDLAGYNSFFLNRHVRAMHSIQSVSDALYLLPEHRKGMNGIQMLVETDRLLKEAGSMRNQYAVKTYLRFGHSAESIGAILIKLGYQHTENVYTKLFLEG